MFKMVHINTRSLLNKLPEIQLKYREFEVIIITESWLSGDIPSTALSIEGYYLIRQDHSQFRNKNGGGIYAVL